MNVVMKATFTALYPVFQIIWRRLIDLGNEVLMMTPEEAVDALKLEETRFAGEGGDLILLHSLRKAEQAIEIATPVCLLGMSEALLIV
jgi:hypothetical protein